MMNAHEDKEQTPGTAVSQVGWSTMRRHRNQHATIRDQHATVRDQHAATWEWTCCCMVSTGHSERKRAESDNGSRTAVPQVQLSAADESNDDSRPNDCRTLIAAKLLIDSQEGVEKRRFDARSFAGLLSVPIYLHAQWSCCSRTCQWAMYTQIGGLRDYQNLCHDCEIDTAVNSNPQESVEKRRFEARRTLSMAVYLNA